jgi:signal peptide peptidase SppA
MLEQLIAFLSQCFAMREADYSQISARVPVLLRDKAAGANAITMRSEQVNPTTMVGDVAVIDVAGPLSKHPSIMRLFGYEDRATLVEIEQAANAAATDSKVRGVIFRFDTPGGTVSGTEAAGKAIARCTAAKPTVGLVTDMACSAGYWLASQCGTIVANASADVGSIGVVAGLYDWSEALKEMGVEPIVARSTPLKGIGMLGGAVSAEQRAELDRWVKSSADVFIAAVASGRGVSEDDARKWATAQVWSGVEAKAMGLIDVVGGFDEAMEALNRSGGSGVPGVSSARVNMVADGRPKHGDRTMGELLRAYLVTLGLAANASEAQAWEKYNSLKGDERTKADAKKAADAEAAAQQAQGGGDGGGQQSNAQANASQQASPSASQQAPNPPNQNPPAEAGSAGLDRSAIQGFAELAGMQGQDMNQFVALHTLRGSTEEQVRQAAAQHLEAAMPAIGSSRTTAGDDGRESFAAALTDVMTERMGGEVDDPHPRVSEIEHLRLIEIGRRMLSGLGVAAANTMSAEEVALCMTNRIHLSGHLGSVALSHGTSDFSGVLGASANKSMATMFDQEPTTYQEWAMNDVLPNTLIHTEYAMSGIPQPPLVLEGQEYGLATIGEKGETKQVAKYGLRIVLTLEMIINDTLGAFNQRLLDFGGAAKQLRNYLVYDKLNNPGTSAEDSTAFFHSDHNNLNKPSGAAALAEGTLAAMKTAMRLQEGVDPGNGGTKRKLAIRPQFLLVPEELADTAERLVASVVKVGGTNAEPNLRFLRGLTPISDPELSAASATAYYLLGPKRKSPVKSLTLRGYERPTVTRQNLSRTDGIEYQLRDFCGAAAVEYRSAQKNAGA